MVKYNCKYFIGSLDKFLLLSSEQRFDSKMAHYLKQLLLRKKKNPTMVLPYLPYSNKPRKFKAKTATEFRNFPSIYIPHEMKTKDLTSMYMDADDLMTRQERAEQVALIEQVIDIILNCFFNFNKIIQLFNI